MTTTEKKFVNTWLNIRGRLLTGFLTVAIILLFSVGAILVIVERTENNTTTLLTVDLPTYDKLEDLGGQIYHTQSFLNYWIIASDTKIKTEFDSIWGNINRITLALDGYIKYWPNEKIERWTMIKQLLSELKLNQAKVISLDNAANKLSIAQPLIITSNNLINQILDILDGPENAIGERTGGLFDTQYQLLQDGSKEVLNNIKFIRSIEYLLMLIIIVVSVLIAFYTSHKIVTPLRNAIDIAREIASGKRDIEIVATSNDETGELLTSLSMMQNSIKTNEEKLQQSETHTRELFENIVRTANTFSSHSSKVASGDLRERLAIDRDDVMSKLGKDLNTMTDSLSTITKQITESCHNMVVTLEEVKQAVDTQSTGSTEQASSINEITSSLDEIEKSSQQTMDKVKTLGEVAERTRERGQQGLDAVELSIQGMKTVRDKVQTIAQTILELSNQTQQVGEITGLVNTLAQQSKMLALNASIEAAKAGEAGKGFAVVASEVKNLAEQSEQSTTQVQKILEDIRHATEKAVLVTEEGTKGVDHGTALVEQTGEIVRSLSDVIHETTLASKQIAAAVRQEGIGIEQITAGMNEINQVTASFVASVKQTTEAITNLSLIAKNLKDYVDLYKI